MRQGRCPSSCSLQESAAIQFAVGTFGCNGRTFELCKERYVCLKSSFGLERFWNLGVVARFNNDTGQTVALIFPTDLRS